MNEELNLEDIIIERISVQELVKKFQPEIQEILYNSYGAKLESLPEHLNSKTEMEDMLELLLELKDVKSQKIIIMRYGIATGLLMSLEEVANEFDMTRERVRKIENKFWRLAHRPLRRRKQLVDYLNE